MDLASQDIVLSPLGNCLSVYSTLFFRFHLKFCCSVGTYQPASANFPGVPFLRQRLFLFFPTPSLTAGSLFGATGIASAIAGVWF